MNADEQAAMLWDFRCEAGRRPDGQYWLRLTGASGRVIERVGYHPLHELLRALGRDAKGGGRLRLAGES
jgi:hypothetical protein